MTTSALFHIRDWNTPTDFARIAAIRNGVLPESTIIERLQEEEVKQHPQSERYRRVAVDPHDRVLGYAEVGRNIWDTPGAWELSLMIDGAVQKQGIGSALYQIMRDYLSARQATTCTVQVRDHLPEALRFAQHRNFVFQQHSFASALTVAEFDEERFAGVVAAAQGSGMRFFSFAETDGSEAQQRRLWELNTWAPCGQPGYDPENARPFEQFARDVFAGYWFRAEGQIIAADGDRWIGMAAVGEISPGVLYNMTTNVYPEYRRRGIATALKLLTIRFARQQGAHVIRTNNDSMNAPMLAINRKLGYKPEPGYYVLRCSFSME